MDNYFLRASTIFLVGATGIYKGIPTGFALGAHPIETAILTSVGSIVTVFVIHFAGEPVKQWALKKMNRQSLEKKGGKFKRILDKYGTPGLGLLCPGFMGPIMTMILSLILIEKRAKLMLYLAVGITIWTFAITAVTHYGLDTIKKLL